MTFGPEEVEEEGRAEDERDEDAGEDIIRGRADKVVVVFVNGVICDLLDSLLLVDVVCTATTSSAS